MKYTYIILAFVSTVLAALLIYPEFVFVEDSIRFYVFRVLTGFTLLILSHRFLVKSGIQF
jgi:hypothetical protein